LRIPQHRTELTDQRASASIALPISVPVKHKIGDDEANDDYGEGWDDGTDQLPNPMHCECNDEKRDGSFD
jgi:hypothetical protein